ncbi:3,4-dihydroxy-2-butanone-4-phosphate synthase, partial [Paenibacillus sp. OT2-17]|uniref:3,4-dihydroxy-2-butanone-4-phosphate synthase n=1 Tax=Paenibacillus sp. OT2-17 TaxID=2691605 RepID=UPI0013531028
MANVIEHGELEHDEEIRLDSIEEALEDLKNGKVVIVVDDEQRENEGDFIALAEKVSPEVINFMITEGRGLVCVPITRQRAEALELHPMVEQNTDFHGTAFTVSVDHMETTTGISAAERSLTVRALADEAVTGSD